MLIFPQDEGNTQFEELLDSGSTMKVSLTPDRLKTFEVIHSADLRGSLLNSLS
jgi:hypothetical protein